MLPDPMVTSTQATKIQKHTLNPAFNESFDFVVAEITPLTELHVSIWDWDRFTDDEFMGHFLVSLSGIQAGIPMDKWYTVLPKPAHTLHVNFQTDLKTKK